MTIISSYRRVLAAQPDRSVAISSVGLLTNLAALLRSGPDDNSPLDGRALVAQKVGESPEKKHDQIFLNTVIVLFTGL